MLPPLGTPPGCELLISSPSAEEPSAGGPPIAGRPVPLGHLGRETARHRAQDQYRFV
ncbi:hypothetical protein ACWD4T_22945 [Streptomyces umbrinus]